MGTSLVSIILVPQISAERRVHNIAGDTTRIKGIQIRALRSTAALRNKWYARVLPVPLLLLL